jgi:hypothetical protein
VEKIRARFFGILIIPEGEDPECHRYTSNLQRKRPGNDEVVDE